MELPLSLVVKLASIAVHVEESLGAQGHPLDVMALNGLLADPEVINFIEGLDDALLPVKR